MFTILTRRSYDTEGMGMRENSNEMRNRDSSWFYRSMNVLARHEDAQGRSSARCVLEILKRTCSRWEQDSRFTWWNIHVIYYVL